MAVICWRAASKMFEQVSAQEKIINDLVGKLSLVEQRLNTIEPALENVKEAETTP